MWQLQKAGCTVWETGELNIPPGETDNFYFISQQEVGFREMWNLRLPVLQYAFKTSLWCSFIPIIHGSFSLQEDSSLLIPNKFKLLLCKFKHGSWKLSRLEEPTHKVFSYYSGKALLRWQYISTSSYIKRYSLRLLSLNPCTAFCYRLFFCANIIIQLVPGSYAH